MATTCDYKSDEIKCDRKATKVLLQFAERWMNNEPIFVELFSVDLCEEHRIDFRRKMLRFLGENEEKFFQDFGN